MKQLKRILCLLLSAALLVGIIQVFAEEEEVKIYGTETLGILNTLGVTEYTEDDLTGEITRAEFFELVCKLGGYTQGAEGENPFSDLSDDSPYAPYIKTLAKLGIVSGMGNGMIVPNGKITLAEAAAVILKTAGYGIVADDKGGFPSGYLKEASRLEITDGIDAAPDSAITKGMALLMIYNSLEIPLVGRKGFSSEDEFVINENSTFLSTVFNACHVNGVVDGVDISRLMGKNDVTPYYISLDNLEYYVGERPVYDFLGYYCELYYKINKSDVKEVIYIEKTDSNREVSINVDDITDINETKISAWDEESGKVINYNLASALPVIYNGTATRQSVGKALYEETVTIGGNPVKRTKRGKIRLLDNNGGGYDVVFADIYDNYVVSDRDGTKSILYDKFNGNRSIVLDTETDNPYVIIYDQNGEEDDIGSAKDGDVVSVYESAPDAYQSYIKAYICKTGAAGIISQVRDNKKYIYIDEEKYRVNDDCIANCGKGAEPGAYVKLVFDIGGNVAYIKVTPTDEYQFGFMGKAISEKAGLSKILRFMIYTMDETFLETEAADRITVDGIRYKNSDDSVMTILHNASVYMFGAAISESDNASMIRYKLNDEGKISHIDTLMNGETGAATLREDNRSGDDALFGIKSIDAGSYEYIDRYGIFGPSVSVSRDALYMLYPSPSMDIIDPKNYSISSVWSDFPNNTTYSVVGFYTDPTKLVTDFIGMLQSAFPDSTTSETRLSVVDSVYKVWDAEKRCEVRAADIVTSSGMRECRFSDHAVVTGADGTADSTIKAEMKPEELKKGDIIRFGSNFNGEIISVYLYYRSENDTKGYEASTDYGSYLRVTKGYVYDKFEDGFLIYHTDSEDPSVLKDIKASDCEAVVIANSAPNYYTYRVEDGKAYIEESGYNNLKGYKGTGNDCSKVIIQQYYGAPLAIVSIDK